MRKILRVDCEQGTVTEAPMPQNCRGLGGRALSPTIVAHEVHPRCHPLGSENKLVIAPGLLAGTSAPSSGRCSVGGKSPLTGGIKESNAGGIPGQMLGKLGIAAIVLEGTPKDESWKLLKITAQGASIEPADDLAGKGCYEVDEALAGRYGEVGIITIGPAGEMRLASAGVSMNDMENKPGRFAGRGGLGAVMGSKRIKAIVVDPADAPGVALADADRFKAAAQKFARDVLLKHPVTSEALPAYGTAVLVNIINEAGAFPTRNFSTGRFEGAEKISGEAIAERIKERGGAGKTGHPCHPGCIIRCSNIYTNAQGEPVVACLEYESDWALGANCGIDDLDTIAELNRLCNDIGVDTIETGAAIGVAMEAGIMEFGDGPGAIELLKEADKGTPLGRLLGSGAAVLGKAYGVSRVPVVKGQAMPAYDPRAVKGIGVTYATSTMGADHTAGYAVATNIMKVGGDLDPLGNEGQVEGSRNLQIATAALDAAGLCLFAAFAILDSEEAVPLVCEMIGAMEGRDFTPDDFLALGGQVLAVERDFNARAGFSKEDDRLPRFFETEPLPPHGAVFDMVPGELDKVHAPS